MQQTCHKISVCHVNLRFEQNLIQTINPVHFAKFGMQQNWLCHEVCPGSSHLLSKLTLYLPQDENMSCKFLMACASIFREKLDQMHFAIESCHSFKKTSVAHVRWAKNTHCPGALLVSILTSNNTWRTRNAVKSLNDDYEKTTQHFAMMSASDLFIGYMRLLIASQFPLSMLRSAEKRAKRFRNVTRNFTYLLLLSRTSQGNVLLVIQILTCNGLGCVVFITLLSPKLLHKNTFCLHCMVNNVLMFVKWDERQISEYTMYINPFLLSVHTLRFSGCCRGSDVTKHIEM